MNNFILDRGKCYLIVLLCLSATSIAAQNLPNVQKGSVYLTGVKIDGQALEIKDRFQAYNKAIDAFYTFANDENSLYLTLKIKHQDVISKVLLGGVTLTLNHSKSRRDTTALSITFPFIEDDGSGKIANAFSEARENKKKIGKEDLQVNDLNNILKSVLKKVKVQGLSGQESSIISIYNDEGIRAAAMFDAQLNYTYKLIIPLKLLALPNSGSDGFSYQIKTNFPFGSTKHMSGGPPPPPMELSTAAATDFWAEYRLAKK
jgi:hypothetical protein